jgi:cytidylate kinase
VCISSTDGAGAEDAAQRVAASLGFRLINEDIVARAAVEAGVDTDVVADVERRKSALVKLLEGMAPAGTAGGAFLIAPEVGAPGASGELRGLIRSVIEETATAGNVVIVAHAASLALAGRDDVLRAFITASTETRQQRLAQTLQIDERKAAGLVKKADANRADYVKRFYGIGAEQPTHYDLVINTDKLTPDDAAHLIVDAANVPSRAPAA